MLFSDKKADLIKFIINLRSCLQTLLKKEEIITKYGKVLERFITKNSSFEIRKIIDYLAISLEMVKRSTMKCVFIGETSNGKSCTINALLKQIILPSDVGRTTSCFVSIKGYEGHQIYLEDIHGRRCLVADLQRLGNQLSDQTCSVDSMLRVFIPRNMCELFENDVEIIDCPGADYDSNHDAAIIRNCEDSDLFVVVLDGQSTLNESERTLLKKLRKHISNIIILFNKWDIVVEEEEEEIVEQIRKQHQEEVTKFLKDLHILSLNAVNERLFFISALDEIQNIEAGTDSNPEFIRFKTALNKDLNQHAIESKIEKFLHDTEQYKNLTLNFLSDLPNFVMRSKTFDYDTMKKQMIRDSANKIYKFFQNIDKESAILLDILSPKLSTIIVEAVESAVISDELMMLQESSLVSNLYQCFEKNIQSLPNEIKDICVQHSYINMDGDKMERFSKLRTDLDKSMKEYKEYIENNIKHVSLKLKKEFQDKKNKKDLISGVTTALKIISPILVAGSQVAKNLANPVIAGGLMIGGTLMSKVSESLADKNTDMNLEDQIIHNIKRFFSLVMKMYFEKLHCSTNIIVMDCLNEFIEDQRNMDDLLMTFHNLRVQIENASIK